MRKTIDIEYPSSYTVWDLETSGLDPVENRILEIGAMVVKNGEVIGRHSWILNNGIEIPAKITELTGITQEIVDKEGRDPKECLKEFFTLLQPNTPHLTHNGIRFDIPFLANQSQQIYSTGTDKFNELIQRLYATSVDSAVLVKAKKLKMIRNWNESFKQFADRVMEVKAFGVKYNVGICCDEMGIDKAKFTQHRAMGDVELTDQIYRKLVS